MAWHKRGSSPYPPQCAAYNHGVRVEGLEYICGHNPVLKARKVENLVVEGEEGLSWDEVAPRHKAWLCKEVAGISNCPLGDKEPRVVRKASRRLSAGHIQQLRHGGDYSSTMVEGLLRLAVDDLYQNEPDFDRFSSETAQTEWNLAAHLAPEIAKYFEGYSYDIDVMKVNLNNKRPDIIIHSRGSNTRFNLLVVEVKREGSEQAILSDAEKIQDYWFSERLRYQFGATINLRDGSPPDVKVFTTASLARPQSG